MPDITYKNVIKGAIDGFTAIQTQLTNFNASSVSDTLGLISGTDSISSITTSGTTVSGNVTPGAMVTAISKLAVIRKSNNSYATGKIGVYDYSSSEGAISGGTISGGGSGDLGTLTVYYDDGTNEEISILVG